MSRPSLAHDTVGPSSSPEGWAVRRWRHMRRPSHSTTRCSLFLAPFCIIKHKKGYKEAIKSCIHGSESQWCYHSTRTELRLYRDRTFNKSHQSSCHPKNESHARADEGAERELGDCYRTCAPTAGEDATHVAARAAKASLHGTLRLAMGAIASVANLGNQMGAINTQTPPTTTTTTRQKTPSTNILLSIQCTPKPPSLTKNFNIRPCKSCLWAQELPTAHVRRHTNCPHHTKLCHL